MNKVLEYINKNFKCSVKLNRHDNGDLIGLPYEYTVPSVEFFNELYYWDTYFTNIPCHRVVGTNGSLTGYAGGIGRNVKLLELEQTDMGSFFVPKKGTAL